MIGALIGMKQMNDNYFIDTNVLIYALGDDIPKKDIEIGLISVQAMISTQIISEMANVMFRKLKLDYPDIRTVINKLMEKMELRIITAHTIQLALSIAERYGYSWFDSQVIASALENDCSMLYSEDLQHGQMIEDRLRISNPFL